MVGGWGGKRGGGGGGGGVYVGDVVYIGKEETETPKQNKKGDPLKPFPSSIKWRKIRFNGYQLGPIPELLKSQRRSDASPGKRGASHHHMSRPIE